MKIMHLLCIIAMVMMHIKCNSLFYKLTDVVWQSKALSPLDRALGVLVV